MQVAQACGSDPPPRAPRPVGQTPPPTYHHPLRPRCRASSSKAQPRCVAVDQTGPGHWGKSTLSRETQVCFPLDSEGKCFEKSHCPTTLASAWTGRGNPHPPSAHRQEARLHQPRRLPVPARRTPQAPGTTGDAPATPLGASPRPGDSEGQQALPALHILPQGSTYFYVLRLDREGSHQAPCQEAMVHTPGHKQRGHTVVSGQGPPAVPN